MNTQERLTPEERETLRETCTPEQWRIYNEYARHGCRWVGWSAENMVLQGSRGSIFGVAPNGTVLR